MEGEADNAVENRVSKEVSGYKDVEKLQAGNGH